MMTVSRFAASTRNSSINGTCDFLRGECRQLRHDRAGLVQRNIVDAEVKEGASVRHGPFLHRYRKRPAFFAMLQQDGRVDVVVIGKRNQRLKAETVGNMARFQRPRIVGGKRRGPPRAREIQRRPVITAVNFLALPQRRADRRDLHRQAVNEIQLLLRMQCVSVQGYSGPEIRCAGAGPPQNGFGKRSCLLRSRAWIRCHRTVDVAARLEERDQRAALKTPNAKAQNALANRPRRGNRDPALT